MRRFQFFLRRFLSYCHWSCMEKC